MAVPTLAESTRYRGEHCHPGLRQLRLIGHRPVSVCSQVFSQGCTAKKPWHIGDRPTARAPARAKKFFRVRPLKTDSGKHFFGAVAVLGARSARKIVNLCHFKRFPRPLGLACCACVEHACVRVGGVWSRCQGPDPTIPYPLKTSNPRTDRPTRRRQEEISICVPPDFLCTPLTAPGVDSVLRCADQDLR